MARPCSATWSPSATKLAIPGARPYPSAGKVRWAANVPRRFSRSSGVRRDHERAKPDCLAAQPGLNLRLVPTGFDRPAVDAGLTREPERKFTGHGEQDFANSRASGQGRDRPGPLAVELRDHHRGRRRPSRGDYLGLGGRTSGNWSGRCFWHVRHAAVGVLRAVGGPDLTGVDSGWLRRGLSCFSWRGSPVAVGPGGSHVTQPAVLLTGQQPVSTGTFVRC
jgi:hypothetical protein